MEEKTNLSEKICNENQLKPVAENVTIQRLTVLKSCVKVYQNRIKNKLKFKFRALAL